MVLCTLYKVGDNRQSESFKYFEANKIASRCSGNIINMF